MCGDLLVDVAAAFKYCNKLLVAREYRGDAQLYLRNAGIYLAERAFGIVVSFVVYTALARSYGPSLIGTYSYSQTVMLFAVPFLAMGSEGVVIRELVRHKSRYNEIMGSAFVVRCQRAVFQRWKQDVPWAKAGQVTIANGGDMAKEAAILPEEALAPEAAP